jgi:hypothetical protein
MEPFYKSYFEKLKSWAINLQFKPETDLSAPVAKCYQ